MRKLPPGWPSVINGLPLLFIFIGDHVAKQHASKEKAHGFTNHVVLSDIKNAGMYQWPVENLSVIVVLFARCERHDEAGLIAELLANEAKEVIIRYWPLQQCLWCNL